MYQLVKTRLSDRLIIISQSLSMYSSKIGMIYDILNSFIRLLVSKKHVA